MEALIRFEKAVLGYGAEPVLEDVNLEILPGMATVIAGPSGCGKSTLLRSALGLLPLRSGRVWLLGKEMSRLDEVELNQLRQRVGMLFQGGALVNSLTVAENVALPLRQFLRLSEEVVRTLVRFKLGQVGLSGHGDKTPPQLSGGMRKRAALARALALDPELLLCDEPTAGLDPLTAAAMDRLLLELRAALGMTLVVVTHELGSIETLAERVLLLGDRRLLFDGTLAEARRSGSSQVRDFFDRQARLPQPPGKTVLQLLEGGR